MTLREALEAKIKHWRECLERPPAYRCKRCPDGDYHMDVWKPDDKTHTETINLNGTEISHTYECVMFACDKCGHRTDDVPMSIGPLYDMGSAGELRFVCEELEQLLKESA